ncbi:MAG: endo-1,4-beta-xylanase [Cyanobacteria bacterium J06642_11]
MQRRQFIYAAGGSLAALQSHRLIYPAYGAVELACRAYLPHGDPLPKASLDRLYFLTLGDEPLPNPERTVEDGLLISQAPPQWPVAIALQLPVAGFGETTVYADNEGQGFMPGDFPLVLNQVFARDRIARVLRTLSAWEAQGYRFSSRLYQRLETAQQIFHQGEHQGTLSEQIRLWNNALSQALWAGEELALGRARQRIAGHEPRRDFKFGCNAFGYPAAGPDHDRYFEALFNYATVPFYWRSFEPEQGKPRYGWVDEKIAWLEKAGIPAKGHPLIWFHAIGTPNWIREWSYPEIKEALRQRILDITRYYGDRIPYYDVINEAHGVPWGNELNYDDEQFLDLTRMACRAHRQQLFTTRCTLGLPSRAVSQAMRVRSRNCSSS